MSHRHDRGKNLSSCASMSKKAWKRICCTLGALVVTAVCGVHLLVVSCGPLQLSRYWPKNRGDDLLHKSLEKPQGLFTPNAIDSEGDMYRSLRQHREHLRTRIKESESSDGDLLKRYASFAKYALVSSKNNNLLPLPLVAPIGYQALVTIPLITIIGVQKGGTTNLRSNLLTHPLVSGMPNEVHFFDRSPDRYPPLGHWPGDGREKELSPGIVGLVLSEYAKACLEEARMRMVRPQAKLVVVLRDPTDRYFSQLRMLMCLKTPYPGFASVEEMVSTFFHFPGKAEQYLQKGEENYQPYTALCRGENATSADLWNCFNSMDSHNPLYRGLYADQLERWFRVFDPSQIMVIDSSEMFADFTGTLANTAEFAGLPEHEFEYDPSHEFKGVCSDHHHRHGIDFFAKDKRYDAMLKEEETFREWYRPHNERLFKLLGRDMMW